MCTVMQLICSYLLKGLVAMMLSTPPFTSQFNLIYLDTLCADRHCYMQDAVVKGWFRNSVNALEESSAHHRTVAMTAFEIASAMSFLHAKGIVHGVCFFVSVFAVPVSAEHARAVCCKWQCEDRASVCASYLLCITSKAWKKCST